MVFAGYHAGKNSASPYTLLIPLLSTIQPDITTATKLLHTLLGKSIKVNEERKAPWRVDPDHFMIPDGEAEFTPGSVDFAHSWFQARKQVSFINITNTNIF
jgi:hypothetical protein